MKPPPLRAAQALALLHNSLPPSAKYGLVLRDGRACDLALATLLLHHPAHTPPLLFAPQREAQLLRAAHPSFQSFVHTVNPDKRAPLRPYAAAAIHHRLHHLAIGTSQLERAVSAVTSISANPISGDASNGIEMLPTGTLNFHEPLSTVDHATLCSTVHQHVPSEYPRTADPTFMPPQLIPSALQFADQRASSFQVLQHQSDALLRNSVLETSHWGYIVARTNLLYEAYNSGRASRLAVIHAMQRMCLHVSGSAKPLALDEPQVIRLCDAVFKPSADGDMRALPKGRTAAGIVLRPATGRFARRLQTGNDHLMMLTREPDHNTPSLFSVRLRGNYACVPLHQQQPVYWDNRFVMHAAPISTLDTDAPQLSAQRVFEAALRPMSQHKQRMSDCTLYIRQLRRSDWDLITSVSNRVRQFHIPFECIRALPVVFQKKTGSQATGDLVASPHLGLSARPDLYFMAVRLPRFRCLPDDLDPGFTAEQLDT